jgi:putative nucleotidyltransferase with HDIG domain
MTANRRLSRWGRAYIGAVCLAGAAAIADAYRDAAILPPDYGWILLAALTWVSGTFAIKVPSIAATISVSEVFVFALVILFGAPSAILTVAIDGFFTSLYRRNFVARRLLFNITEPAASLWVATLAYDLTGAPMPLFLAPAPLAALVVPVLVLATAYLLANTALTAVAMAVESGGSAVAIWRRHVAWLSVNFLGGASIALLLAVNMRTVSPQVLLLVLPLVFILYLVFRTWTDRLREADEHVAAVNRLYLSTVEALAIAIESKDQVTHGHVRRVQTLSLAIARHIGLKDPIELRAIEAAALLHDMGKVAIPDHILNKPGKLTAAEYELMKLHAPIGAEILSAVDFPYPVVPIVRHHHENWDGTGYPDGIAGEAIPIGARILSVVDCFDALTSDRPYRRALGAEEALRMVQERSGVMYDPAITAALAEAYPAIRKVKPSTAPEVSLLIARANERPAPGPAAVAASSGPAPSWTELDRSWAILCAASRQRDDTRELAVLTLAAFLRAVSPATTVALWRRDTAAQAVVAVHVSGHGERLLRGRSVRLGEGISGWVAANGAAIVNSDPALDFAERLDDLAPRPRMAVAVPIGEAGVLSLYTDDAGGFSQDDRLLAAEAADRLAPWLEPAPHDRPGAASPAWSSEPANTALNRLLDASAGSANPGILSVSLASERSAHGDDDHTMDLAALVLPAIRLSDGLFAAARDEIVVVLPGCESEAEELLVSRLRDLLNGPRCPLEAVAVGFGVVPRDGPTAADALTRARSRRQILRRRLDPVGARARVMAQESAP